MRRAKERSAPSGNARQLTADESIAPPAAPRGFDLYVGDELEAVAALIRPATLDPHTAADLILNAEAYSCLPNDSFCYVCEVQLEQREGRRV